MSPRGTIREVGTQIVADGFDDALVLWEALDGYFLVRRPVRAAFFEIYPDTTVGDVQQVAALLATVADQLPKDALGRSETIARWRTYRSQMQRHASGLRVSDVYPDNEDFWTESRRLALDVSAAAPLPTKGEVVLDAVKAGVAFPAVHGALRSESILDSIADVVDDGATYIGHGAVKVLEVTGQMADTQKEATRQLLSGAKDLLKGTVGGVADAVIKPLLDTLGTPLLIGAAVVGGVLIVPKLIEEQKRSRRKAS